MSYQQPPPDYRSQSSQGPYAPLPRKKSKTWVWIIALVIVFFVGIGAGSGMHGSDMTTTTATNSTQSGGATAPASTTEPTAKPLAWKTTQTFTGNGTKKTDVFTVTDTWKLQWKCNPASFMNGQYNVIVAVTNSDGTTSDPAAINTLCQAGNTSGTTTEHQGGNIYLDVNSEGTWTLMVQEQK